MREDSFYLKGFFISNSHWKLQNIYCIYFRIKVFMAATCNYFDKWCNHIFCMCNMKLHQKLMRLKIMFYYFIFYIKCILHLLVCFLTCFGENQYIVWSVPVQAYKAIISILTLRRCNLDLKRRYESGFCILRVFISCMHFYIVLYAFWSWLGVNKYMHIV